MDSIWIAILSGGAFAAIIEGVIKGIQWKRERKAVKEDRAEEKADKTGEIEKALAEAKKSSEDGDRKLQEQLNKTAEKQDAIAEGVRLMLLDRILYLGKSYISDGEISYDDRRRFHQMHDCYHKGLGGNGDADLIVEAVDELQLNKH